MAEPTTTIYRARDEMQAEFLVQVLASHEIEAQVRGAALQTLAGYLPAHGGGIEVCVDEADVERARPIVKRFDRSQIRPSRPAGDVQAWTCSNCGEIIEPQFTDCWKCQSPRPGSEQAGENGAAAAPPRTPPVRLPPDPHVRLDLSCVRCDYNLRGLEVDRPCPECAHPAMASLLGTMQSQQQWALDHEPQLTPCVDYIEGRIGFAIEAVRFVMKVWPRAVVVARRGGMEMSPDADDFAEALHELAGEFFGDPLTAARAMQRWNIFDGPSLERLLQHLWQHGLIDQP